RRSDFFGTTWSAAPSSWRWRSPRWRLALDQPDDVALEIAEQRHDDRPVRRARHERLGAERLRLGQRRVDVRHLHVDGHARGLVHRRTDAAADAVLAGA